MEIDMPSLQRGIQTKQRIAPEPGAPGAGPFPSPAPFCRTADLVAFSAEGRTIPGVPNLIAVDALAALLRRPEFYPLFMKEVGGKYGLSVVSADNYNPVTDEVLLLDGSTLSPASLAEKLIKPRGYLVQLRLRQAPASPLWSVRVFVTMEGRTKNSSRNREDCNGQQPCG